jgi:hypothetical protein
LPAWVVHIRRQIEPPVEGIGILDRPFMCVWVRTLMSAAR